MKLGTDGSQEERGWRAAAEPVPLMRPVAVVVAHELVERVLQGATTGEVPPATGDTPVLLQDGALESAIDHYSDDVVGWHVAKLGDRWAALEPLRQGPRELLGFRKDVARGLKIRCDWGPQYIADAWITEVKWLGMTLAVVRGRARVQWGDGALHPHAEGAVPLPPSLRDPGAGPRDHRRLHRALQPEWLIERLDHRTPAQARAEAPGGGHDRCGPRRRAHRGPHLAQERF